MYSVNLEYGDTPLRDMFYAGLKAQIKEHMLAQDFDHAGTTSFRTLAERALKIDQRIEAFRVGKAEINKETKKSSSSAPTMSNSSRLAVGDYVYTKGKDGRARKGQVSAIKKNSRGGLAPFVRWSDGTTSESQFRYLNRDMRPVLASGGAPSAKTTSSGESSKGPAPMDISAEKGKAAIICNKCGGKGHFAKLCPTKSYSGNALVSDEDTDEEEDTSQLNVHFKALPARTSPGKLSTTLPRPFYGWAMIDSGASSCFIHKKLVEEYKIPTNAKEKAWRLRVIDGREIASGIIDTECSFDLALSGNHIEPITFNVANIGRHDVVLGMSWLKRHSPLIDWKTQTVSFVSDHCVHHCLKNPPIAIRGKTHPWPEDQIAAVNGLPEDFWEFEDIFSEDVTTELPPHREWDLAIDLEENAKPKHGPIYSTGPKEDEEMKTTIERQLKAGHIRPSKSPMASPVLFVRKKNGKLHMVVDYHKLNAMTIKNRYPLPLTNDLIEKLRGAVWFTKLDLKTGYNLVRIREGDEWKTAFKTKYGLFESLVMPFGLTNAPAAFQSFMNDILRDLLDVCVVAYLDDILIYTKDGREVHIEQVKEVLSRLRKHHLYCQLEKCSFIVPEVDYLGLIASGEGVRVDPAKVTQAVDWPKPKNVKNVQEFLGFVNFYRRFIPNYSRKARSLFELLKKDQQWQWTDKADEAFCSLKDALVKAPILLQPDPNKEFYLECDSSNYATGAILSQKGQDEKLHPIAFFSKSLTPAERNYDIFDKELLAVIKSLKEWRHLLEGTELPVQILTDHKNLEYFMTKKALNKRQIRWANFLADYNFVLKYRPGTQNKKADILSCRADHEPEEGGETAVLLNPDLFIAAIMTDNDLDDAIRDALRDDPKIKPFLEQLEAGKEVENWTFDNGLLSFNGRIYVPQEKELRRSLIESRHDAPSAGHPGQFRTLELLQRNYYWPGMKKSIALLRVS
ncbi:Retrotransposable element Tf2 [Ceratobasidium theobromae]|uniref:RNA-directed DNA polymerase n=1 Tax=Ceratobasidium theobromae TaxID=1582974 RepID=A0A5N5Q8D0_9AGAM|nr:Retrotransposable element Tf2 [Ceratobasidium theobromae]